MEYQQGLLLEEQHHLGIKAAHFLFQFRACVLHLRLCRGDQEEKREQCMIARHECIQARIIHKFACTYVMKIRVSVVAVL